MAYDEAVRPRPTYNNWMYRKRVMYLTLIYCVTVCIYLLLFAEGESSLHVAIANNLILLAATSVGTFVFGHIADGETEEYRRDDQMASWNEKRGLVFVFLLICAIGVTYLVIKGEDTEMTNTFADGLCLAFAAIQSSYVFGAVWSDSRLRKTKASVDKTVSDKNW
ncbi:hypothetical protein [Vibrio phage BONAISHI]|nr:hypothetical protein [Vibrio phage BONAISHI]